MNLILRAYLKLVRIITDITWDLIPLFSKFPSQPGLHFLMYHGIDSCSDKQLNYRHISAQDFEKQIIWLKKHTNIISLKDAFEGNYNPKECNVVITFDDAYRNVYTYAFPIIVKNQIDVSIFATGADTFTHKILWSDAYNIIQKLSSINSFEINNQTFIRIDGQFYDKNSNENFINFIKNNDYSSKLALSEILFNDPSIDLKSITDYWEIMTEGQIKEMAQFPCINFGSHGFYHNNLGRLPFEKAIEEIKKSKEYLESITGKPIQSIAYPDGCYSKEIVEEAKRIGLIYQLGTEKQMIPSKFFMNILKARVGIYPIYSWKQQLIYFFKTTRTTS